MNQLVGGRLYEQAIFEALLARLMNKPSEGSRWKRLRGPFIDCFEIQIRSDKKAYCGNIGVHLTFLPPVGKANIVDANRLSCVDCEIKKRLSKEGNDDQWWEVNCAKGAQDFVNCFEDSVGSFFGRYSQFPDVFTDFQLGDLGSEKASLIFPMMTKVRICLLLARVYDQLDNSKDALEWAEQGIEIAGMATGPKSALKRILRKY